MTSLWGPPTHVSQHKVSLYYLSGVRREGPSSPPRGAVSAYRPGPCSWAGIGATASRPS